MTAPDRTCRTVRRKACINGAVHRCHGLGGTQERKWTTVFASERLTGALLDRITHHVHILEMNGQGLPAQAEPVTTPASVRTTPACPRGPTGASHARADASRAEGASPRARVLPMDYGDKLPPRPWYIFTPVHFYTAVDR